MRDEITPEMIREIGAFVFAQIEPYCEESWDIPAAGLEWDVRTTVGHMTGAVSKYTLSLAARATRFLSLRMHPMPDVTSRELASAVPIVSDALASVAASAPPGARGFHVTGMADAEGMLGMAAVELICHGADVVRTFGAQYQPPETFCRAVVDRMFPWSPHGFDGWATLEWATGRRELPGQRSFLNDEWPWLSTPFSEWNGVVPDGDAPMVSEFVWDDSSATWRALQE